MQHFARQLRLLLILMFLGAFGMHAQFDSTIQGIVTDNTHALIPGAKVTVTNVATGVVRTAETPDDGFYRVLSLAPGTYRVAVHKPGFADAVRDSVTVTTGQILRADFSLEVSSRAEQVTVAAQTAMVDTEQGNISGRIDQIELKETPLNGNNVFNLLALQAGMIGRRRSTASGGG